MAQVPKALRYKVAEAARHRCGYCLTSQQVSGAQMHIEHIIPLSRGGSSDEGNLWLACAWCNSYKGAQMHAVDPLTGEPVSLFNPRMQVWSDHFRWNDEGTEITGLTPSGRATIAALRLNNEFIVSARRQWVIAGWHPPKA